MEFSDLEWDKYNAAENPIELNTHGDVWPRVAKLNLDIGLHPIREIVSNMDPDVVRLYSMFLGKEKHLGIYALHYHYQLMNRYNKEALAKAVREYNNEQAK